MKRALLYILLLSFVVTPVIFATGVAHVHAGPADMVDVKVTAPSANLSCFGGSIWDMQITINWGMCAASVSYYLLLTPVSWAFGTAGFLLNMIVQELIFRMGAMTGMLEAVTIAWSVMRDIANVVLVFLILFIGIATIVRATSYNSKQLLYRVIIAALLVNFSLYFTKVIIDVTNIFAAQTYIMILKEGLRSATGELAMENPEECANSNITKPLNYDSKCFTIGISGAIENILAINTIYKDTQGVGQNNRGETAEQIGWNIFYVTLLGTILLVILTFIFLAVIILFITRFVTLVYLMIISPVAFVSLVTGRFGYGKTWWNQLINNAVFAPVYFLLLWVAMLVIRRMMLVYMPAGGSYSALALAGTSGYTLLIVFMVAAALLIGALMAAKKLGVAGTSVATKFAGDMTFGVAAMTWRQTGGRHGERWANDEGLKNRAAGLKTDKYGKVMYDANGDAIKEASAYKTFAARKQLQTAQKMAKSSGDLRQNLPKGAKSYFESKVGTLGEGHKGGYAAMKKAYVEGEVKFGESLGVDTKRQAELEGERDGKWEEVKDENGKPVIDPATGKVKRVWKKGVTEQISDQQKKVRASQKEIAAQEEKLAKLNAGTPDHDKEMIKLRAKQQELSTYQAEGRALEERRRYIDEELPKTNRGFMYAENLGDRGSRRIRDNFGGEYKIPGLVGASGVITASSDELSAASAALRKKQKAQQKHRSLIDAFHYMKDEGILPEDLEGFDETLMTGTPTTRTSGTAGTGTSKGPAPSGGASGGTTSNAGGGTSTGSTGSRGTGGSTGGSGPSGGTAGPASSGQAFQRPPSPRPSPQNGSSTQTPRPSQNTASTPPTPPSLASTLGTQFNTNDVLPQNPRVDPRFNPNETDPAKIRSAYSTYMRDPDGIQTQPVSSSAPATDAVTSWQTERAAQINPPQMPQPAPTRSASAQPAFDPKVAALTQQRAATTPQATSPLRPVAPVVPPEPSILLDQYKVPKVPIPQDFLGRRAAEEQARKVFGKDGPFTEQELGVALQAQAAQQQKDLIDGMPPVAIRPGATGITGMDAIDYLQRNRDKIFVYDAKTGAPKKLNDALPSWDEVNRGAGFGAWGTGRSNGINANAIGGKEVSSLIELIYGNGPYRFHPDVAARFGITQKEQGPIKDLGLNMPKKSA